MTAALGPAVTVRHVGSTDVQDCADAKTDVIVGIVRRAERASGNVTS